ncbi:MAG TPA: hypothetical protein VGN35_10205 [Jatrophihabitantaceae bacterium]|nr:hypothetical protein [Jatrophihabitantaceae bacterium]
MATSRVSGRHLTIELGGCSAERFDAVATTLRRLFEIGVRLSYEPAKAAAAFHECAFEETRFEFGTSPSAAQRLVENVTLAAPASRPAVLASGVATGDHLMAALSAGATYVDGAFAGTVRCDRSNFGEPSRVDDVFAYL